MFFSRGHSGSTLCAILVIIKTCTEDPEIVSEDDRGLGASIPKAEYFAHTLQSVSSAISHMNVLNIRNSQSAYYTYRVQTQFQIQRKGLGERCKLPAGCGWYPGHICIIGVFWAEKNVTGDAILVLFRTKMSTWTKKTVVLSVLRFFKIKICCPLNFCSCKQLLRRQFRTLPLAVKWVDYIQQPWCVCDAKPPQTQLGGLAKCSCKLPQWGSVQSLLHL